MRALALLVRDLARSGSVNEASEVLGHLDALPALPAHARETLDLVLPARATRLSELVERALAQGSALQLP